MSVLKKTKAQNLLRLQEKLRGLEQVHIDNKEPSIIHQTRNVKQEMDKILSEEVEKNIRFMKQRYYEAGPKACRLREQDYRPCYTSNYSNLDDIQNAFETYYQSLYSQSAQVDRHFIVEFLNSLDLPMLGKEVNDKLVSPVTVV